MKNKVKVEIIIYAIVLVIMCCTLFFSSAFESFFKLKPDLSGITKNSLTVHFVDVGQGDAILVRFPNNKTMLVDSGSESSKLKLFNYINNVFFNGYNNRTFDYVMLTHPDVDHAGNMLEIINNYKIKTFLRPNIYAKGLEYCEANNYASSDENYLRIVATLYNLNINMKLVTPSFSDENINKYFKVLTPIKSSYTNENNFSPIVVLEHNNVKFMLTGDATTTNELEAINNYSEEILNCDVLKLGHHGSNTSTNAEFLKAVSPKAIVISAGKNNSYLHPSTETMDTIYAYSTSFNKDLTKNIYETSKLGNIIFSVNNVNSYLVTTISNVNDYAFIGYWAVLLIAIGLIFVCIIIPKIYKRLNKGKKKIL